MPRLKRSIGMRSKSKQVYKTFTVINRFCDWRTDDRWWRGTSCLSAGLWCKPTNHRL